MSDSSKPPDDTTISGRAVGAKARADKLSASQRAVIAKNAALARWGGAKGDELETNFGGIMRIGDIEVPCAVLPDGVRVVSERGLVKAFGGKRGGSHWIRMKSAPEQDEIPNLPVILSAHNLREFIEAKPELIEGLRNRYLYRVKGVGAKLAYGIRADLFPKICDVYLRARDAGKLEPKQHNIAIAADILMRGLAEVGITALVDEATGYQEVRDRLALQEILAQFVGKELAKWERKFPREYYREIFRLKGWSYNENSTRRPMLTAQITADLIYRRLAPGVLAELRRLSPKDDKGRRKNKLFQRLTLDVGHPALSKQLDTVVLLSTASDNWDAFMRGLERVSPRYGDTLSLPFD